MRTFLRVDLPGFARFDTSGTWWERFKRALRDGPGWRGLVYGVSALPVGIAFFVITVVVWSVALGMVTLPAWAWALPDDGSGPFQFGDSYVLEGWGLVGYAAGVGVLGLALLGLVPRIVGALARADRAIVAALLSPDPNRVLAERVEQLTVSRDASVEGSAVELRRIERDLHDGAQQRLVALAMDLGMAKERLIVGAGDPGATDLVTRAHEEAKLAITELRDLVRGIHPQVLTDRGLDAALSALAARSPVPVAVDVTLVQRPPPPIEAAAYFVVAESLANVAKHSRATRASVRIEQLGERLLIDVRDDGMGGAAEHPGSGLSGLRDRVAAVEGTLRLASPPGGPTDLHVELPCAS